VCGTKTKYLTKDRSHCRWRGEHNSHVVLLKDAIEWTRVGSSNRLSLQ